MTLLWAFILLGILVWAHELGHFLVAKATGVRVLRFSIGFGPRLFGLTIGETDYRLSLIPFGGYVKLLGQESSEPLPQTVMAVAPGGPADQAGIRRGDGLVKVGDREIGIASDVLDVLPTLDGIAVPVIIWRDGREMTVTVQRAEPQPVTLGEKDPQGRPAPTAIPELGLTVGDDEGDKAVTFFRKPLWARFLVVLAGPLASLLFPLPLYFLFYLSVSELPSSRIGQVLAQSPAATAGLKPGDRIVAIDDKDVRYWPEMAEAIRDNPGKPLRLRVERNGATFATTVKPEASASTDALQATVQVGRIGIQAVTSPAFVGVDAASAAFRAGVRNGDRVASINGTRIDFMWQFEEAREKALKSGGTWTLVLERPAAKDQPHGWHVATISLGESDPGLYGADTLVGEVRADSPAAKAGLESGDRVLTVNGRNVTAWTVLDMTLREARETPVTLEIMRDGRKRTLTVHQEKTVQKSEYGDEVTFYRFGAYSLLKPDAWLDGEFVPITSGLSFAARGAGRTLVDITTMELRVLGMLVEGNIPFKTLGGPIMIFDVAGKAAEKGWQDYLWIMAMISINLGILNLLPVPVLDGGHLMFFTIEGVLRRPLNQRVKERAIMVGFTLLMLLMAFVMKNDVERYWDRLFS